VIFRPYYYFETGCAAYVLGCGGLGACAVVDAHEEDVDEYVRFASARGMRVASSTTASTASSSACRTTWRCTPATSPGPRAAPG
jgi:hypothetical protein